MKLSDARNIEFDAVSDLIQIKKSQLYQIDKEKRRMKKVMFKGST